MKKRWIISCIIVIFVLAIFSYIGIQRKHTFTLTGGNEITVKSEQIQPLFGTVKVNGDCDTNVVFTDVETGKTYEIGYITHGVSEKIKLQKGRWYAVAAAGNIRIAPVNVRIE